MVKIKGKIFKDGGSYAIRIPKALIDTEILEANGKEYTFVLETNTTGLECSLNTNSNDLFEKIVKFAEI